MYSELIFSSDGVRFYCRRYGEGLPLIMVHGSCVNSDFMHETAEILSSLYTVYTYDRRGYGRSSVPADSDHSIRSQAEDLVALIRLIGEPCYLVAHSFGCTIAMELATRYPELIRAMLLHEPSASDLLQSEDPMKGELGEIAEDIKNDLYSVALFRCIQAEHINDSRARPCTTEEIRFRDRDCTTFISYEFSEAHTYIPNYTKLKKVPVVVGLGELSRESYHWRSCPALSQIMDCPLVYFPGGHNCAFDLPREFSNMTIGTFLLADKIKEQIKVGGCHE